jgi:hypothetical protein
MTVATAHPDLLAAVALSRDVVAVADRGDLKVLAQLDAKRLQLLKSFRSGARHLASVDRTLLMEITRLNEQALGLMEHRRRIKGRELDLAAVGRRAVAAYAINRQSRHL